MSQLLQSENTFASTAPAALESSLAPAPLLAVPTPALASGEEDSLFEHFAWLYVFFRERLFRNDTGRIIRALWPDGQPASEERLLELGCGPGFYSCELATRFPELSVLGVDRSVRQLECAGKKASTRNLQNCHFEADNVLALSHPDQSFDALVSARLFTVLPDQERAVSEMYRVLRPGGRCFVAEPRYAFWASLPLLAMWVLAGLTGMNNRCREPGRATVLSGAAFAQLFASQPWSKMKTWQDGRYQYALCEKG